MAGKAAANAQQDEREQDELIAAASTQPAAAPSWEAAPTPEDLSAQLKRLADLRNAGVLTDEEFALAKQKLLTAPQ